ncbi:MAG TPA: glycoside hydrolase family 3 C-terminal domain-containing protein [Cellvibrio sp.]|nr:glycoside hydrolase family 3 C-terminal domain-containing protein [Cellvibrio sp.]
MGFMRFLSLLLVGGQSLLCFSGQPTKAEQTPIYRDSTRSFEMRAADLVARMTLEEKASQMLNDAPAIPRLGIPKYEWWNEALHGVARAGDATVFPQAISLAATFDPKLVGDVARAISDEGRAKHHEFAKRDQRLRYQGLTFWSPNINIFRDPRWGRGQETYGEDPYLTSRMGVEFVKGLQGDYADAPTHSYRKTDATAKHFAVHSGPEADRHQFDVYPSERDLYETYLPAFKALVQEANVASVMGAYNRVNGESASASQRLLIDVLRKEWGFTGYVVSDCDSIEDIFLHHKIVKTAEEAAALGVKKGTELNCGKTYQALVSAVKQGLVTEAELDDSLRRLFLTRFRLGMFDPDSEVPWAQIPYSANQSAEHDQLARRAAQSSIVLLKNDGILPLKKSLKKIAVIGPTADEVMSLLGNYYGTPAAPVTILQGIRAAAPDAQIAYARGVDLVEGREDPRAAPVIESRYLRPSTDSAEQGLRGDYFKGVDLSGKPVMTRIDSRIAFRWDRGAPTDSLVARGEVAANAGLAGDNYSARWTGQLLPPVSGTYELNVSANDGVRLKINGKTLIDSWELAERLRSHSVQIELEAGKAYDISLEYFEDIRDAEIRLGWRLPGAKEPFDEAIEIAQAADVIVFVGGLTGDVEGEEMKVNYPGFAGGDRTDIRLPAIQQKLLEALHKTGKPVVMVLTGGAALAIDWADKNLPAIVMAWYPGQRGGSAVGDVLFGRVNPAGRLPVTFYKAEEKLPAFDDYSMRNRTYRYFTGEALYSFGHGLSYTNFKYSKLVVDQKTVAPDQPINLHLQVKNSGKFAGDEVVQLYLQPVDPLRPRALKELRAIQRVHLQKGEARELTFTLVPNKDLLIYDDQKKAYAVDAGRYEIQLGASSRDIRLRQVIDIPSIDTKAL